MSVTTLKIKSIRKNGGTQPRAELNKDTLKDYKESWLNSAEFPPITVWYDGENYWLSDGFHRLESAKMAGLKEIRAEVRQGTQRDAILESVGVNAEHGLRRSNADKRRAVETLLNDSEWGKWSDREIARRTKTSAPFVSKIRSEVTVNIYSEPADKRTYTNRYGNTNTMNTGNIGTKSYSKEELDKYTDEQLKALWEDKSNDKKDTDIGSKRSLRFDIEYPFTNLWLFYNIIEKNDNTYYSEVKVKLELAIFWKTHRNIKWKDKTPEWWTEIDEQYYKRIYEPYARKELDELKEAVIEKKYTYKLWKDNWFDYRENTPFDKMPEWWTEDCEERLFQEYLGSVAVEKNKYWNRKQDSEEEDSSYYQDNYGYENEDQDNDDEPFPYSIIKTALEYIYNSSENPTEDAIDTFLTALSSFHTDEVASHQLSNILIKKLREYKNKSIQQNINSYNGA